MHHDKNCTHEHKGFLACVLSWKGVALILVLAGISYYLLPFILNIWPWRCRT